MPCYQSTSLPAGASTTGRTGYATEADCLNACKEGACCEGTTCSVKPQCQCQGTGQTFKGIGTVCTPCRCVDLNGCVCSCTKNGGVIPRFLNLSVDINWARNSGPGSFAVSQSATLTRGAIDDTSIGAGRRNCWAYASPASLDVDGWAVSVSCRLETAPSGAKFETMTFEWFTKNLSCPRLSGGSNFARNASFTDSRAAGDGSGLCFASHAGQVHNETESLNALTESCGRWIGTLSVNLVLNGFAA
jgi:hypothetical protein